MQNNSIQNNFIKTIIKLLGLYQSCARSERAKNRIKTKKDSGLVYNHTPFGYKRVGNNLIKHKKEVEIILKIKSMHRNGRSYRSIAKYLSESNVKTKKGKTKWYASSVKRIVDIKELP